MQQREDVGRRVDQPVADVDVADEGGEDEAGQVHEQVAQVVQGLELQEEEKGGNRTSIAKITTFT